MIVMVSLHYDEVLVTAVLKTCFDSNSNKSARDATGDTVLNETHLPSSTLDNTQSILLKLISFLDAVIVAGMMMEDDHYLLQMTTLDFLELVKSFTLTF